VVAKRHSVGNLRTSEDEGGCLLGGLDLEEGVRMVDLGFASLTEVEIVADAALVADSDKGENVATVASHSRVDNGAVLLLGLVNFDLRTNNLGKFG
jgi:hypothetical protein